MKNIAIALESVGIVAVIVGIAVETTMGAHIGFVAITGGAVMIAAGSLVWSKLFRR